MAPVETDEKLMNFAEALSNIFNNVRMTAKFLPENVYVQLKVPDENSQNTVPYIQMITVAKNADEKNGCEPWSPGSRSIFSQEWYVSPYQVEIA